MTTFDEMMRTMKSAIMHPPKKIVKVTIAAEISGRVCREIRWCSVMRTTASEAPSITISINDQNTMNTERVRTTKRMKGKRSV
jgi:hypothetical protein